MENTLQKKIYEVCEKYPHKVAIEYGDKELTYGELDKQTNKLANYLVEQGVTQNTHIGILSKDRMGIILSMIAVLKAGAVFIILDPNTPKNRFANMVDFSDITHILCANNNTVEVLQENNIKLSNNISYINYETILQNKDIKTSKLNVEYSGEDKISLFFTSGSTGKPKAILGRNKSIKHFIDWETSTFNIDSDDKMSQFTPPTNDAFFRDVFVPLFLGATLCIPLIPDIILSNKELISWLEDNQITLIHCTPSLFYVINNENLDVNKLRHLKYIFTVGEALKLEKLKTWFKCVDEEVKIINLYGSTETSLAKMYYEVKKSDLQRQSIPIGKEIPNVRAIVLDTNMNPCVPGDIGELYIRTPYLSYGYYKNEDLTKQLFIINPFTNKENDIIYKTGDLARVNDEGDFELIGRKDRQIKVRGNRVEISEIENIVLQIEEVEDCVVNFSSDANSEDVKLYCYIIWKQKINHTVFKELLRGFLPEYMIPTQIIDIDKIPLTSSGKVNYKELPIPAIVLDEEYIAPQNDVERKVEKVWCELLNLNCISTNKKFFDVGGHSLKIMSLISNIYKVFGIELSLEMFFENPTLREMAKYIEKQLSNDNIDDEEETEVHLTPTQQLIVARTIENKTNFKEYVVLSSNIEINVEKAQMTFEKLLQQHEALRMYYSDEKNKLQVKVKREIELSIKTKVIKVKPEDIYNELNNFTNELIKEIEMTKFPLIKIGLLRNDLQNYIIFVVDSLIMDEFSWKILIEDFINTYEMLLTGEEINIHNTTSFKKWCNYLYDFKSNKIKDEIKYWKKLEEKQVIQLQKDYVKSTEESQITVEEISLNEEQTSNLLTKVNEAYNTKTDDLLLTAIVTTLSEWINNDILISIISQEREIASLTFDVSRAIGCFTTQYPIIFNATIGKSISEKIKEIKETIRKVPNKGIGYGVLKNGEDEVAKEINFQLKPEVTYKSLNILDYNNKNYEVIKLSNNEGFNGSGSINFAPKVVKNELKFFITYDGQSYKEETIKKLALSIQDKLIELIEHCIKKDESERTISDIVIGGDLDTDDLLSILNNLS